MVRKPTARIDVADAGALPVGSAGRRSARGAALASAVLALMWGAAAQADPNAEFLAALREAGWNDTAAAFVEWVDDSPLATEEFRDQLAYERAVSLAAQGRAARDRNERRQKMAEAAATFQGFAEADAESDAALDALRQAANLYAELALGELAGGQGGGDASRRTARGLFEQATAAAQQLRDECTARLAKLPKPAVIQADPEAKALRDQLRNRLAEAGFLIALVSFESARTYEAGSNDWSDALDQASDQFGKLVEEYRGTLVGASSRFYQGRCAQELGEHAKALGCFEDLIDLPPAETEFRRWTARAHRRRAESLIALGKWDDAIRGCRDWLEASQPAELQEPEWLEVAYQLALAYQKQLADAPAGRSSAKQLETRVRELLQMVAARPNEFQRDARRALASGGAGGASGPLDSFGEAFAAAKTALELMNSSLMAAKVAEQNNPEAVEELKGEAAASKRDAQAAFERALDLADEDAPIGEVNAARYYLAWLYWEAGRTEEAAVLGEFVARRYADSEFGPGAAKIALAAWERLYNQDRTSTIAGKKLIDVAQMIASQWPEAPEAASAISILINVALRDNRIEQAEELLAQLPEGSRAGAELSLGSALWTQYLNMTQKGDAAFDPEAAALRDKAEQLLTSGYAVIRDRGQVSTTGAVGALYLVQLLLARGDAQAALEVLEHDTVGPLTLVKAGSEAASQPKFVLEAYKAALRAYLSLDPPRRDDAQAMMDELDAIAARQGGNVADQLTSVYVGLGLQLQQQIKDLTAAGQHMQAQQVAAAFGDVLDRVAQRPDAGDWAIRRWIAQTNLQIGQGLSGAEARKYLERARDAFQAVLAAAEAGGDGAPDANVALAARKQLGDCLVALGQFKPGIEEYAKVLRTNEKTAKMLDVQLAAAAAYQTWGATAKLEEPLYQSIHGAMVQRGGQNLIWGWLRIANAADGARRNAAAAAANDPKAAENKRRFTDLFFEARYNVAKSRFLFSQAVKSEDRQTHLNGARKNVESMRAQYPDLGGPKWKAAFEALLADIQEELKKS